MEDENIKETKRQEAIKEMYNASVRLLQLLNIIIPKLGDKSNVAQNLLFETEELAWGLGTLIATDGHLVEDASIQEIDDDEDDNFILGY